MAALPMHVGLASVTAAQAEFECTDVGSIPLPYSYRCQWNAATCNATVTVIDNTSSGTGLPGYYGTARRQWQRHDHGF